MTLLDNSEEPFVRKSNSLSSSEDVRGNVDEVLSETVEIVDGDGDSPVSCT